MEKFRPIEALLQGAGIKAELSADALLPLWTKYIFIGPMAGVTSLTGKPFGEVLGSPDDRVLVEGMMKEIEAVARKEERQLPAGYRAGIARQGRRLCAGDEDLHAARLRTGQPTELDIFIAYMVKAGKELGIPVPLHRKVYAELMMRG